MKVISSKDSKNEYEAELAKWFNKVKRKKDPYDDNKQEYFNELLEYLSDFGFFF